MEGEVYQLLKELQLGQEQILSRLDTLEASQRQLRASQQALNSRLEQTKLDFNIKYQHLVATRNRNAALEVFNTTELVEAILLELPVRDILKAQRICKRFKSTIDGSQLLQRALFFLPDPLFGEARLNPLLTNAVFLSKLNLGLRQDSRLVRKQDQSNEVHTHPYLESAHIIRLVDGNSELNVLLRFTAGPRHGGNEAWQHLIARAPRLRRTHFVSVEQCKECAKSIVEVGSWKHMYLSQPPMDVRWSFTPQYQGVLNGYCKFGNLFETDG